MSTCLLKNGLNLTNEEKRNFVKIMSSGKAKPKYKIPKSFVSIFEFTKTPEEIFKK
jgi:hypothetical protein